MNALPAHINIAHARLPETYASAKTALANCASIDECQDWANKAEALASYARMSDDEQLENLAKRIRARAIRRCGELLKSFDADKGGRPRKNLSPDADEFFRDPTTILGPITRGEVAERAGISRDQMHTAMKVADVPQEKFDAAVESNQPPGVKRLAASLKPQMQTPEGFREATQAIGTVADFARFCERQDPAFVAGGVLQSEVQVVRAQVAIIDQWLDRFVVSLKG